MHRHQCVTIHTRMKLDRTLVRNVMREVTQATRPTARRAGRSAGGDPDGDRFLGHVFLPCTRDAFDHPVLLSHSGTFKDNPSLKGWPAGRPCAIGPQQCHHV